MDFLPFEAGGEVPEATDDLESSNLTSLCVRDLVSELSATDEENMAILALTLLVLCWSCLINGLDLRPLWCELRSKLPVELADDFRLSNSDEF